MLSLYHRPGHGPPGTEQAHPHVEPIALATTVVPITDDTDGETPSQYLVHAAHRERVVLVERRPHRWDVHRLVTVVEIVSILVRLRKYFGGERRYGHNEVFAVKVAHGERWDIPLICCYPRPPRTADWTRPASYGTARPGWDRASASRRKTGD